VKKINAIIIFRLIGPRPPALWRSFARSQYVFLDVFDPRIVGSVVTPLDCRTASALCAFHWVLFQWLWSAICKL